MPAGFMETTAIFSGSPSLLKILPGDEGMKEHRLKKPSRSRGPGLRLAAAANSNRPPAGRSDYPASGLLKTTVQLQREQIRALGERITALQSELRAEQTHKPWHEPPFPYID